jgi:hypothetical protein
MTKRKAEFLSFGGLGLATFVVGLSVQWLKVRGLSPWTRILASAVDAVPWLIGAALLVLAVFRKRWVPLLAFAGSYVVGAAALLALLFGTPVIRDYASRTSFDSARWKSENRRSAEGIRVRMVDDLLRTHKLIGMQRAQLEALLGVPPSTPYFSEYDFVYWLGPERGPFSIDSEWLVVKLQKDVVVAAEVVTD